MTLVKILGNAKFFGKTILGEVASSPTYAIGRSLSAVDEGSSVTFTLSTTNVANGTLVPYTITGISANDVTSGSLSGSFIVSNNLATATITMSADQLTEGAETATLTLNNAAASNFVVVNDTSVFTPNLISGLQLWLDAADSSTLFDATAGGNLVTTDGSAVARWADKSGNGRHATQGTVNARPLLKTSVKNGRNVLRFDGSNDIFSVNDLATLFRSARTIFAVARTSTGGRNGTTQVSQVIINGMGTQFQYLGFEGFPTSTTTSGLITNAGASIWTASTLPYTQGNFVGLTKVVNYTNQWQVQLFSNGTAGAVNQMGVGQNLNQSTAAYIGAGRPAEGQYDFFLSGDISEILFYNTALTTTQRQSVETYLNNKWALY